MKKSSLRSIFSRFRAANADRVENTRHNAMRTRVCFETLESREMLAVGAAEYATILQSYPEFDLPQNQAEINIIEIPAEAISLQSLKDAIETAGSTKKDDLVVIRTTDKKNLVEFSKPNDQLQYEFDSEFFGSTSIVALGSKPLTIDAQNTSRILSVAAGKLSLGNIVLTNGSANGFGGNVVNRGELTLKNCVLTSGTAATLGANIYSSGTLSAIDTSFTNAKEGVGVYNVGALDLDRCSIENNAGGGIYIESYELSSISETSISKNGNYGIKNVYGSVELNGSTITANASYGFINSGTAAVVGSTIADNADSGIYNSSFSSSANISALLTVSLSKIVGNTAEKGAGVFNDAGTINISNTEFSGNAAKEYGGAIYCAYRPEFSNQGTVVNCTIAGNAAGEQGGGIYVENTFGFALYNSVVSMNYAGDVGVNVVGNITSRNNLLNDSALFVVSPIFDYAQGKLVNAAKLDLRLTKNSPAINIGDNSRVNSNSLDLAGNKRVYGKAVDAGAYEYSGSGETAKQPVYVVDTLKDVFDLNDGKTSLREAIYFAAEKNAAITFKSGLKGKIELGSQLIVTSSVIIDGGGRITIDAGNNSRAFLIENEVELRNLTIVNAQAKTHGGAIYASSSLTLDGVVISSAACGEGYNGACVYAADDFNAKNSQFVDAIRGELLYLLGGSSIAASVIANSPSDGVYACSNLTIAGTKISGVERGIVNDRGVLTVYDSTIYENRSYGVDNTGSLVLERCVIEKNANSGIYNRSILVSETYLYTSTVDARNTIVRQNVSSYGAGIYNLYGRVELTNCELSANSASVAGGGYYCETNALGVNAGSFYNVTVAGNAAGTRGGGIALADNNALLLLYNTIAAMNLTGDLDSNVSGEITLSQGSFIGGAPGFAVAPIFDYSTKKLVNPDELDLRLTKNSPLIDKGDNDSVSTENLVDLAGNSRVYVKLVDPGAYEYHGTGETSVTPTYRVTSLSDTFDPDDGKTTLREALYWASQDGATITFASSLSGSIKLKSQLVSTANVTIEGNGKVTISGSGKSRVLLNEGDLVLKNITLTAGKTSANGTIVYNSGTLTLDDAAITGGTSTKTDNAAIYNVGTLNVYNSTISDADASSGIYSSGMLVMRDSVVENNAVYGVYNVANATLAASTISANGNAGVYNRYGALEIKGSTLKENKNSGLINLGSATVSDSRVLSNIGSGLVNLSEVYSTTARFSATLKVYTSTIKGNSAAGDGGGVYNAGGLMEITNSEISANTADGRGGGVYNAVNDSCLNKTTLINCTIAGNSAKLQGGGLYINSLQFNLAMYNTIVAQNYSSSTNVDGYVALSERNLTSGNPAFVVSPRFDENGTLQNAESLDLRLTAQSVAVDAGSNDRVSGSVDLDENPRVFNTAVDIGAYEHTAPISLNVTTLEDSFDLNDDATSLREALYWAQSGDVVTFAPGLKGTISLKSTLVLDKNIAIVGNGLVTISGRKKYQILNNTSDSSIENLTFSEGYSKTTGGAIYNTGTLTIIDCVFSMNSAANGGAIYSRTGSISIENSKFLDNNASTNGGAIHNLTTLSVVNSTFTRNAADGKGGAIYDSGTTTIVGSLIADSTAKGNGGAIYKSTGILKVFSCTIAGNTAELGGGLYVSKGSVKLYNDVIVLNSTDFDGSASTPDVRNVLSTTAIAEGTGNKLYNADLPLFVDAKNGNYRLAENSQATDAGSSELARNYGLGIYAVDLVNVPRVIGDAIDLGAYENDLAADIVVQETGQTILQVEAEKGDKVYWDLSGTGNGEYVKTTDNFILDAGNYTPGYHLLRYKVVSSKGVVKSQKTISLHVTAARPLVSAERVDFGPGYENFVVFTVDARFFDAYPNCSWRVNWGDGTTSSFDANTFTAAKYYDDLEPGYTVELILVGEDGLEEFSCQLGRV